MDLGVYLWDTKS